MFDKVTKPAKTIINALVRNTFGITLDKDVSLDITNPPSTNKIEYLHLNILQDGTGSREIEWPSTIQGTPSIDSTPNSLTVVVLFWSGVKWIFESTKGGVIGNTVYSGTTNPVNTLGINSDLFIQNTTNHLWRNINGIWNDLGRIIGLDGEQGNTGPQGVRGAGLISGQADPVTVETGFIEGDKLLNTINGKLFEIVSNAQTGILEWIEQISTIFGADGNQGDRGDDGNKWFNENAGDTLSTTLGKIGDFFVTGTNDLLQKIAETAQIATSWGTLQTAFGEKGDTGEQGIRGEQGFIGPVGIRGSLRTAGTVDPTISASNLEGDEYVNILTGSIWHVKNINGTLTWVKDIETIIGTNGENGTNGSNGTNGINGTNGTNGSAGTNGERGNFTTSGTSDPVLLTNQIAGDQYLNIFTASWWILKDINGVLTWIKDIETLKGSNGTDGIDAELNNLGEISDNIIIDLNTVSKDFLSTVIAASSAITFSNIPDTLFLEFKTIIKTTGVNLSIEGTSLNSTPNSGDVFVWTIQKLGAGASIVISFQTYDEKINFPVTLPQDFTFAAVSDEEIRATWNPPETGNVPISYDLWVSTEGTVDSDGNPNGTNLTKYEGITDLTRLISGLTHSTTYYGFIRAKNIISTSLFVGPIQTNTDVPLTASDISLTIESPDFQTISGSWVTPENRDYRYDVKLTEGGVTETIRNNSRSTSFSRNRLKPNVSYSYLFEVYNEFERKILSVTGTVTTGSLPVPTLTLSVSGTSITAEVVIPVGVSEIKLEAADHENTNSDGSFQNARDSRTIKRSSGSDLSTTETITDIFSNRNSSTVYYVHCASEFLGELSEFSSTESITTGAFLAPGNVSSVRATSPDTGQVRLKWRWFSTFRGEWASVTRFRQGVEGHVDVDDFFRENDSRDLDERENRAEFLLENQPSDEQWVYVVTPRNQTDTGGADTDSVNVE